MVFGWGRKKPDETPQVFVIRLDEAANIANEARQTRAERTITEAGNLVHRTNTLIRELVQIRKDLERDDLVEEEVDKRIRPLVIRGKKMLIGALRKNAVEIKPVHAYEDMVRASNELEHRLKRVGNILGKQTRIIHVFAEKYAIRLKQILEEVEENRKQLLSHTTWYQNDTALKEAVTGGIDRVHDMESSIKDSMQRTDEAKRQSADTKSRIERATQEIAEFKESPEYNKWLELCNTMDEYKKDRLSLKTEISTQFTKISRPLGRYSRISADKDQSTLLKKMLDNSYDTIKQSDGESVVMLLEGVRKATASGSISVKDTAKAVDAIIQTQEAVTKFIERVNRLETKIQDTAKRADNIKPTKLYSLEDSVRSLQETQELTLKKIRNIDNATKSARVAIPAEIKKIHNALEKLTGTRYDIKYVADT